VFAKLRKYDKDSVVVNIKDSVGTNQAEDPSERVSRENLLMECVA
jgi:hypothetical protein